jgi:hypothetical protein
VVLLVELAVVPVLLVKLRVEFDPWISLMVIVLWSWGDNEALEGIPLTLVELPEVPLREAEDNEEFDEAKLEFEEAPAKPLPAYIPQEQSSNLGPVY